LIKNIRKNQSTFLGHIIKRAGFDNTKITGKISGKRVRGRPRENILDGKARWLDKKAK
jgi:hypothetical protein